MFSNKNDFQPFESKVWLSSPTMYPDSMKYVMEAYETNWMSTVGANINEVERKACEKVGCKYGVLQFLRIKLPHICSQLSRKPCRSKARR